VVRRYWDRAHRFAAMVTRNDQDSVDVAQDALLLVTRRLHRFDPERGTFDAWLWRIVVNVARDASRTSLRRRSLMERLRLDRWTGGEPDADPEALALRHLSDGAVLAAVRRLRPRPRTIIAQVRAVPERERLERRALPERNRLDGDLPVRPGQGRRCDLDRVAGLRRREGA
jgi:RNA polymerase sigma factor (sigma-70 family)